MSCSSAHVLTTMGYSAFSGMGLHNFSSLARHIGQPLNTHLTLTALRLHSEGKGRVFPFTHSAWVREL